MWNLNKRHCIGIWDAWNVIYMSNGTLTQRTPGPNSFFAWFRLTHSFSLNGGKCAEAPEGWEFPPQDNCSGPWDRHRRMKGMHTDWNQCQAENCVTTNEKKKEWNRKKKFVEEFLKSHFEKSWGEQLFKTINIADSLHATVHTAQYKLALPESDISQFDHNRRQCSSSS